MPEAKHDMIITPTTTMLELLKSGAEIHLRHSMVIYGLPNINGIVVKKWNSIQYFKQSPLTELGLVEVLDYVRDVQAKHDQWHEDYERQKAEVEARNKVHQERTKPKKTYRTGKE